MFELFTDVCPKTCENFRCLCTGQLLFSGHGVCSMSSLYCMHSSVCVCALISCESVHILVLSTVCAFLIYVCIIAAIEHINYTDLCL